MNYKMKAFCLDGVSQLVRASSRCAKIVGSIPDQDTWKNQLMNKQIYAAAG